MSSPDYHGTQRIVALISPDAHDSTREMLDYAGFSVVQITRSTLLNCPLDGHPDLRITKIGKHVFCSSDLDCSFLDERQIKYERLNYIPQGKYPGDSGMNIACTEKHIFCNPHIISDRLLQHAREEHLEPVAVHQGYCRCCTIPLFPDCIITADQGIVRAAAAHNIDCLCITQGSIILKGFKTGFIGGCCGIHDRTVYFNGNISAHPDGRMILDYLDDREYRAIYTNDDLEDIGSILFF